MATTFNSSVTVTDTVTASAWKIGELNSSGDAALTGSLGADTLVLLGSLTITGAASFSSISVNSFTANGTLAISGTTTAANATLGSSGVSGKATLASLLVNGAGTSNFDGPFHVDGITTVGASLTVTTLNSLDLQAATTNINGTGGAGSVAAVTASQEIRIKGSIIRLEYLTRAVSSPWRLYADSSGQFYASPT